MFFCMKHMDQHRLQNLLCKNNKKAQVLYRDLGKSNICSSLINTLVSWVCAALHFLSFEKYNIKTYKIYPGKYWLFYSFAVWQSRQRTISFPAYPPSSTLSFHLISQPPDTHTYRRSVNLCSMMCPVLWPALLVPLEHSYNLVPHDAKVRPRD